MEFPIVLSFQQLCMTNACSFGNKRLLRTHQGQSLYLDFITRTWVTFHMADLTLQAIWWSSWYNKTGILTRNHNGRQLSVSQGPQVNKHFYQAGYSKILWLPLRSWKKRPDLSLGRLNSLLHSMYGFLYIKFLYNFMFPKDLGDRVCRLYLFFPPINLGPMIPIACFNNWKEDLHFSVKLIPCVSI